MKHIFLILCVAASAYAQFDTTRTTFSTAPTGLLRFETSELMPNASTQLCQGTASTTTRTSGTALSIGATSSATLPVSYRFGYKTRQQTAANTLTITAGTGSGTVEIYAYLDGSSALAIGIVNPTGNTLTCSGACAITTPGTVLANQIRQALFVWTWTVTSGAFNVSGGIQKSLASDCWVDQIWLANTSAGTVTVVLSDGRGAPFLLLPTVSLLANTTTQVVIPGGAAFESGLLVTAGTASAINVRVRGGRSF